MIPHAFKIVLQMDHDVIQIPDYFRPSFSMGGLSSTIEGRATALILLLLKQERNKDMGLCRGDVFFFFGGNRYVSNSDAPWIIFSFLIFINYKIAVLINLFADSLFGPMILIFQTVEIFSHQNSRNGYAENHHLISERAK